MNAQQSQSNRVGQPYPETKPAAEIPREIDRLADAARSLSATVNDLSARLGRFVHAEPPSPAASLQSADAPTGTDAGREIRELSLSVESSTAQLHALLRNLAV